LIKINFKIFLKDNKEILKNFSFLSILQFFQLIIGFLLFPYLIKVLGMENYGVIIFAQAITAYFLIVLNYGLNITATKQVAKHKEDQIKLSEIISSVYVTKIIILIILIFIFFSMLFCFSFFNDFFWIYILTFFSLVGWLLYPEWYFQGIEKMENITYVMMSSKVLSVVFIFLLVKSPNDFYYVPVINSASMIISGIIGVSLMRKSILNRNFIFSTSFESVKNQFNLGFSIFLANIVANTKDYLNTFIIGALLSYQTVAVYDLANKIVKVLMVPSSILYRVVFPRISVNKSIKTVFRVEKITMIYSLFMVFILFVTPDIMIRYIIDKDLEVFKKTLLILSFSIPLLSLCGSRGVLRLVGFNKDKYFMNGIIISVTSYLFVILALYCSDKISITTMAIGLIFSIVIELLSHFYYGFKEKKLYE